MSDLELWHFIRAAGLLAYVLLWLSVMLGMSVRARSLDGVMHRAWVFELHQTVGIMGVLATALHIFLVTRNIHVPVGWQQVFVPMSSDWKPWAVTFGLLGSYLMLLVALTSLLRRWLPYSKWRFIHYASFPAWLTALVHGLLAGTDSGLTWLTWTYALSAEAVFLLLLYRVFLHRPKVAVAKQPRAQTMQQVHYGQGQSS